MPRTLVVGDVHGCSDELRELVAFVRADRVILVGDLFTKGPDPVGVWRQMVQGGFEAVLGNHDARLSGALDGARPNDRHAAGVCAALDAEDPTWRDALRALPLWLEADGWTIIHAGLHPSGSLELTDPQMAISMRRWPIEHPDQPHWHQVYEGERRVVFGHDALRGLVRVEREGKPLLIGLDSGCVYGGKLSGYVLQTDEIVQIPAARVYKPVG